MEAINTVETVLRELVVSILSGEHGQDWISKAGISEEKVAEWEARRLEESKRREGATVDQRLIAYAQLFEIRAVRSRQ